MKQAGEACLCSDCVLYNKREIISPMIAISLMIFKSTENELVNYFPFQLLSTYKIVFFRYLAKNFSWHMIQLFSESRVFHMQST